MAFLFRKKQEFEVIIERDEDGFFVAHVPALPGCVTQAKTYSQLKKRVRQAIKLCLEVAKTDIDYHQKIKIPSEKSLWVGMEVVAV